MTGVIHKKVLMLCYHYPPEVSGGVERSARFAKSLPEFGWKPIVVTTTRYGEGGGRCGEELVRVGELLGRVGATADAEAADAAHGGDAAPAGGAGGFAPSPRVRPRESKRSRIPGPALRFAEKWILVPDKHERWTVKALLPALRLIRREKVDAIYSTSPPASAHVLGGTLKRLTGKPWVMDLRDPWTLEPLNWYLREGGARLSLEKRIESICFAKADAIITSTGEAAERYAEIYPACAGRIHYIPNGYDAAELEAARSSAADNEVLRGIPEGVFVVSHVGTFCRYADMIAYPKGFLEAIKNLVREKILSASNCRIIFAGGMRRETAEMIEACGLADIIVMTGPLSHLDALRTMLRSDLLLLYDPNRRGAYYVHGKLYEYLASGKWILGIVPGGAAKKLLDRSGHGIMAAPDDEGQIRAALLKALEERKLATAREQFDISQYEARSLTRRLACILDGIGR